ncbi:DoxX family protein [Leucobacter sp. M11]|uniref:DoxX family protein n=1 Tax=Leucobacter sp. M11 TaxID=2993565 RepID=UPI002D7EE182|nr:DoxX family protein [Leucobacter sp. M11]MEB4616517.1 DoxX family protein [Leucobacter sp. M11]
MIIAHLILATVTGLLFLMAGGAKLVVPIPKLREQMSFAREYTPAMVRFVGWTEVLGGLGTGLAAWLGIQPWISVVAALGLVCVMALAARFHLIHDERSDIPKNVVLGLLALATAVVGALRLLG